MILDKLIVTLLGIAAITFVYWFFFMKKDVVIRAHKSIDIKVDGGYSPDTVSVPAGETTKLNFYRTDTNTCLEEVVISDFKIKRYLPLNQRVSISVTPDKPGVYPFTCGMNMFHGKLIVK